MGDRVVERVRQAWRRTTVPLRVVELLVALVVLLTPWGRPALTWWPLLLLLSAAWVAWTVADPFSMRGMDPLQGRRRVVVVVLLAVVALSASVVTASTEVGWVFALAIVAAVAGGRDTGIVGGAVVFLAGTAGVQLGLLGAGGTTWSAVLGYPAGLLSAVLGGVLRAMRRDKEEQSRRLLTEQARGAALAERSRIAREVHDVLAHSLGGLAIQLEVADALLSGDGDLDERRRAAVLQRVRTAHDLATAGLEDTRRAVHALRVDAPPLPDSLAALAAGARENGTEVSLRVEGRPRPLGAGEVALLRTAQEALVNAAKHAPGAPVTLELSYRDADTELVVTDGGARRDTSPPGSLRTVDGGYGLAGLRERLELAGGSLAAGPHGTGWRVTARVLL
ncbi:histidine kinase [Kineococcus sp. NPDC059986]|uniref:sensor histidine kinase n=1 Tax=Kineococcus sp. NPDC059986 TaxID=3155538 RepID=UPI00344DBAFB